MKQASSRGKPRLARPPGPAPDAHTLREAALRYLSRYAATQAGLLRVLNRRIDRWAYAAGADAAVVSQAKQAAAAVAHAMVQVGGVDDAAFAASRARSLSRAGRSRRAITAHLAAKGVPSELATPPDDPAAELAAALSYARRRRMGPFRAEDAVSDAASNAAHKELARMGRAGFEQSVAAAALRMDREEAEACIVAARE